MRTLNTLGAKWDPCIEVNDACPKNTWPINLDLTGNMPQVFNKDLVTRNNLHEGFCIFAEPQDISNVPPMLTNDESGEQITVYTNGSCISNGGEDTQAGSGVWFGVDDDHIIAL